MNESKPKVTAKSIMVGSIGLLGVLSIYGVGIYLWFEIIEGNHQDVLGGVLPINEVLMLISFIGTLMILFFVYSLISGYDRGETLAFLKGFFEEKNESET